MKLRYAALGYGLFMAAVLLILWFSLKTEQDSPIDMTVYNERIKQIEEGIFEGMTREELEKIGDCSIFLRSDADYGSRLNDSCKKRAFIMDIFSEGELLGKAVWLEEEVQYQAFRQRLVVGMERLCLFLFLGGELFLLVFYICFLRPFKELQKFSGEIAKGNLDFPLPMQKTNFFGAFTESFDIMREELLLAKEREYAAQRSKKELMAGISHDIKTPLSTMKAAVEVLQLKEKNEETLSKLSIVANRAEMIEKLIDNMFQESLDELDALKFHVEEESSLEIYRILEELKGYAEIRFVQENDSSLPLEYVPEKEKVSCLVWMDKLKFTQVIDNCVNNAKKYADTPVRVTVKEEKDGVLVKLRDFGRGVPEEELALLTEKFYRGSNTAGKAGSGLGLYLSRLFMERMQGGMEYGNVSDEAGKGFLVTLFLKKV